MNKLDKDYQKLLQDILENGTEKSDRTGTGTISVFGRQIRHNMQDGFPLLTTKKMAFKTMVTELLWFLRGDTNIKYLVDNGCNIWNGDAYKNYVKLVSISHKENGLEGFDFLDNESFIDRIKTDDEFAKKWGELGPVYGNQWRNWEEPIVNNHGKDGWKVQGWKQIDQIRNLIKTLKTNPDSRRMMVNAWNVGKLDQMVLPPCHYGFQVYTRELSHNERINLCLELRPESKFAAHVETNETLMNDWNIPERAISLMWNQRSVDTFLGLPFNIASYGLLLEIIAKEVNMIPDELIGNLGDVHLYKNHIEQAKEQIGRERTHEEMFEIYNKLEEKKDRKGYWTWQTRFEYNNIQKHTREPFELPKLGMDYREGEYNKNLKDFTPDDFYLINYQSHPTIKAPLSN